MSILFFLLCLFSKQKKSVIGCEFGLGQCI